MGRKLKIISRMFAIIEGNIADKTLLDKYDIDTIVNAANPTLKKIEKNYEAPSVNLSVHETIDGYAGQQGYFEQKIQEGFPQNQKILCPRGQAVLTNGYGLCEHIIHVVGSKYDCTSKYPKTCSSSRIEILESCYREIVNILKQHTEIKILAIPIIGSGNYGFPFELAARIAMASMVNACIEWKTQDPEMFELTDVPKIYFVIYDKEETVQKRRFACINKIWQEEYKLLAQENQRIIYQKSWESHFCYIKEILTYDEARGYFSVARGIRLLLMHFRFIFFPLMCLKDIFGKSNWKKRRQSVEFLAIAKIFLPLFFCFLISRFEAKEIPQVAKLCSMGLVIYSMCDTITYLLILIIMADIQRPSANLIRSMLMLFVNYIEVTLDLSFLYWSHFQYCICFSEALNFGILGQCPVNNIKTGLDYIWPYLNASIQFFFLTLVFGYLANHMHQRKFIS